MNLMKNKKPHRKITIVVSVIVLATMFCTYWTVWRVSLPANIIVKHIDDYRDYYFMTEYKPNTMPPPFGSARQIIYFKPGQKGEMLDKIKEDVVEILDTLIEEHGDICNRYEISTDFMCVNIYLISGDDRSLYNLAPEELLRISSLVPLYHYIKEEKAIASDQMINYIEADS